MNNPKIKLREQSTISKEHLGIRVTKEVQNLHSKKLQKLLKEIKENLNKWKDIPRSWTRRLNTVIVAIFPKFIYRLNIIPIKIPAIFLAKIDKLILKFI